MYKFAFKNFTKEVFVWTLGHISPSNKTIYSFFTMINKEDMFKVYVSYKRADKDKVFPLVRKMESELGIRFWVDFEGIESDEQFSNVIVNAINECEVFLFMYSKAHENINHKKDWTVREITYADMKGKRIVFINLDDCELSDWFLFYFPHKQVTQANDNLAMDHLVEDIREWLRLPQPNLSSNNHETTIDTVSIPTKSVSHPQTDSIEANNPHPRAINIGYTSATDIKSLNVDAKMYEIYDLKDMPKVFVSYKRADKDKILPIVSRLESELGFKLWIDLDGIENGRQFTSVIINAINECEVFLFMYSKTHEIIKDTENDYTVRELNYAQIRHKRIVFIDVEGAILPDWFIFNFPQWQETKANDNCAMVKLVADIRRWLRLLQPDNPQAIDLGFPSGTKWASCNVGATKPEEFGGYYAWGEAEEKKIYNEKTYAHKVGLLIKSFRELGGDIAGTKYDVAHMKCGGNWRMPTIEQIKELVDNCITEWTEINGVKGRKFTSKINGNSIFLPAAGYRDDSSLIGAGSSGGYWSSIQDPSDTSNAYDLYFNTGYAGWRYYYRNHGLSIRPVVRN